MFMAIPVIALADNSGRIAELQAEGSILTQNLREYQEVSRNIQIELIRKQAQIEELQRLDAKSATEAELLKTSE